MSKRIPNNARSRVAAWLHENEPVRNLRIECVEHATRREIPVADAMRALEQANLARFIPGVGWVSNFVTGDKCAELAQHERSGKGWFVRSERKRKAPATLEHPDRCADPAQVTCNSCESSWCERCDPAPGPLCHVCHGRGYSTAQL